MWHYYDQTLYQVILNFKYHEFLTGALNLKTSQNTDGGEKCI